MGRILIKGGIWKNTEDEILKAAVMKYGLNQWSRIASLLHRKSAKQCKSRWNEWLDPSIKKTEWSKEEEEKLLHLAKIFPTQWRTISSMIEGRTTEQCLEHYEEMLDRAQPDESKAEDDPRRLRPGEIDPKPETRPARPDPVDMDEDELEMLSEARARLANTQGKKAKRKAREKQLEEARRLASLQKRRELKMAGINIGIGSRKRKKGINYNTEIPFEKPVPVGVHDISDEVWQKPEQNFRRLHQDHLDGEMRKDKEDRERKKDASKLEKKKESGMPIVVNPEATISKRSKLCLPAPKVTSSDLEETFKLVKTARASEAAVEDNGSTTTDALRCEYPVTPTLIPASKTPSTNAIPSSESIIQETRNLIALQNVQTPLMGGENTPLIENPGFGASLRTPGATSTRGNLIPTPFRTPGGQMSESINSARSESTTASTPMIHDHLKINPDSTSTFDSEKLAKEYQNQLRAQVKQAITSLPAPKNDFDLVFSDTTADDESVATESMVADQADLDAHREELLAEQLEAEFRRKSKAVQRDLPRPSLINNRIVRPATDITLSQLQEAEESIKKEMLILLHRDVINDPASNQVSRAASQAFLEEHASSEVDEESLKEAKILIEKEAQFVKEKMGHGDLTDAEYAKVWEECLSAILFLPDHDKFVKFSDASKEEKIDALRWQLKKNRDLMAKEAKKANKVEKKLNTLLGGYMMRSASLIKQLNEATEEIDSLTLQKITFLKLKENEQLAIDKRVSSIEKDVSRQIHREKELQEKFDALTRRLEQLKSVHSATSNGKT